MELQQIPEKSMKKKAPPKGSILHDKDTGKRRKHPYEKRLPIKNAKRRE